MAGESLIGNLAVLLTMETAAFEKGTSHASKLLRRTQRDFEAMATKVAGIGQRMSLAITAPLVGFGAVAIREANEANQAMGQVNAALKSMGPVAGRTAEQLKAAADALEMRSLAEGDEILRKVTANLLTFGNISGTVFDQAQQAALDLSARMGTDLQSAAVLVGKALNDPIKGMAALGRAGIQFSVDQQEAIKAMVETGNLAGAQAVILKEFQRQFGGAAQAAQNADPFNKATDAFKQMAETVGQALLPIIPVFTDAIVKVANAFSSLSPGMQKFLIIAGGVAAALGPVMLGIGGLISATGLLLPLIVKLGPAFAGGASGIAALAPLLARIAPLLGPIGIAALAVYAAFKNWDKIAPFIQGVVDRTTKAATDINAKLKSIQDGANSLDQRLGIPSQQQFISSILSAVGGAVAKVDGWLAAIQKAAADFDRAVNTAFANAGAAISRMVTQASAALMKLQAPFDWVKRKASEVGNAFRTLYDRVVGNSYVPDMVDEIGQHMARLDALMVAPVTAATKKSGEAFKALQDRVSSLLARLFPEQARNLQFLKDLQDLKTYADQAGWSVGQLEEALRRLHQQTFDLPDVPISEDVTNAPLRTPDTEIDWDETSSWIDTLGPKIDGLTTKTGTWAEALASVGPVADRALAHFADGVTDIIMNSDSLGEAWKNLGALFHNIAQQIIADLIRIAIQKAIVAAIGGGGFADGGQVQGFASGGFVRGPGGPKADRIPAMLSNGEFVVNAKATKAFLPLLQKINRGGMRFATGGMVSRQPISDRIQIARGGEAVQAFAVASPVHFDLRGAVMTQDLLNQMNEMSLRAADQGANMGVNRMRDLNQRTFGRAAK